MSSRMSTSRSSSFLLGLGHAFVLTSHALAYDSGNRQRPDWRPEGRQLPQAVMSLRVGRRDQVGSSAGHQSTFPVSIDTLIEGCGLEPPQATTSIARQASAAVA